MLADIVFATYTSSSMHHIGKFVLLSYYYEAYKGLLGHFFKSKMSHEPYVHVKTLLSDMHRC